MKSLIWVLAAAVAWLGASAGPTKSADTVFIAGDFAGQLTPCGCVKPMVGGVLRLATAVKALNKGDLSLFVVNGAVTKTSERQSELKAEALGELLGNLNCDALAPSEFDRSLGEPLWDSVSRLSKGVVQLSGIRKVKGIDIAVAGPNRSIASLTSQGWTILLWDGDLTSLKSHLPKSRGKVLAIVRSATRPQKPEQVRKSFWAVSPGEKGKFLLSVGLAKQSIGKFGIVELGPQFEDDPAAKKIMGRYLARVQAEQLIERMPRLESAEYVGSNACYGCHESSNIVWQKSAHAQALKTLEKVNHDRDPDCVGCHVVGLDHTNGFESRALTPSLADVGCESCHGPGKLHTEDTRKQSIKRGTLDACTKCHNLDHSPGFDPQKYWSKIKH